MLENNQKETAKRANNDTKWTKRPKMTRLGHDTPKWDQTRNMTQTGQLGPKKPKLALNMT
jgi:hypothetical protein